MSDSLGPLDRLYTWFDSIAKNGADGDSSSAHDAILTRLGANRRVAEGRGWTALALERVAGMGRLRLWGLSPSSDRREIVPDWAPQDGRSAASS